MPTASIKGRPENSPCVSLIQVEPAVPPCGYFKPKYNVSLFGPQKHIQFNKTKLFIVINLKVANVTKQIKVQFILRAFSSSEFEC